MGTGNHPLWPSLGGQAQGVEVISHVAMQAGESTVSSTENGQGQPCDYKGHIVRFAPVITLVKAGVV